VERDKLKLKLDMLQSGKSWEEACGEDCQVVNGEHKFMKYIIMHSMAHAYYFCLD
jgi:hypothetical protein